MPLSHAEINQLKGDLQSVLKGKCLEVVQAILKKLNAPTDDLMSVFAKVTTFEYKSFAGSASVLGTLGKIDAGLMQGLKLTMGYKLADDPYARADIGRTLIHELIHAATKSTTLGVMHYQMDQAAWDVAKDMGVSKTNQRPSFTPTKERLDYDQVKFFGNFIMRFCRVPGS